MQRPVASRLGKVINGFDLTLSQWKVLDFIEKSGSCTLVAISRHFSIEKPSVTRTVNCLEEKQLVEKIDGKDKREKRIQLTCSGKEEYTACRNTLDEIEVCLMGGISHEEQRILLQSLIAIRDNMKSYGGLDE
jgi:MarR family transcriptional regulator, transcriptional regulator for hemolysin